jgi:UDP-4-amino-4,6-dideoxy-N-acetyl-beta-L-altrosamine transaminase
MSSATAALHLACRALDLGPGDRLWTTPNTFVASANCGLYCGAEVDFVDIDPQSYNISVAALGRKLEQAASAGRLPKIVVPVDFAGQPADMAEIAALGIRYGFRIVEDASHAIGATYRGSKTGCSAYADITVFSFHPVKIITTGEGGMALTNHPELFRKLSLLRSHGISRELGAVYPGADKASDRAIDRENDSESDLGGGDQGGWYYEQTDLGYNYRMTDLQAALGRSQLGRLDEFVARRRFLAARYDGALRGLALHTPWQNEGQNSAWHLYVVVLDRARTDLPRRAVYDRLRAAGVMVNVHYIPVHLQPYYRLRGFKPGDFPEAEAYYGSTLSLPLFFGLTEEDQDYVVEKLAEALR